MSDNVQWLPVAALKIDEEYQRTLSPSKVAKMAREWDDKAVDIVVVSQRTDGYYVIDGQHRVAAARKRGVTHLLCQVHANLSQGDEARLFDIKNSNRKTPDAMQTFKAKRVQGDPSAALVDELAAQIGRTVAPGKSTASNIRCAGALRTFAEQYPDTLRKVWPLIGDLCQGEVLDERLVRAFMYAEPRLAPRSLTEATIARRLVRMGYRKVMGFLSQASAAYNRGGDKVWALGLLNAANHGVRSGNELEMKP
jgi:methylmalonyl-CoA mutase cobalamin-binding subunit